MADRVLAAGIYARISSDQEGTALGVGRQLDDCRKLAERLDWKVADEYVDNHVSAYSGKARPEFERLIEDLDAGVVDGVLCYDEDRLARRLVDSERFIEVLRRAGNRPLHFVTGGSLDLTNGDGLMFLRLKTTFAAHESDTKSRRVRRKMDEIAAEGRPHGGGTRPFGYEWDRVTVRPEEAEIIRQMAGRFLAGESLISLTRWLNDEGVPTSGKAREWRTATVRGILRNPRFSGQRTHHDEIVGPATWPAIITPEQTTRLRAILDDPARRTNRTARRYALAGMLRCGRCGATLLAHPRQGVRRYHCKTGPDFNGCGGIYIDALRVEELISEAVLYRLDTPDLAAALAGKQAADDEAAALSDQIAEDAAQLEELANMWAAKEITRPEWATARQKIDQRLEANRRRLARMTNTVEITRYIGQGKQLRTKWAELNLDRQRAVIRTVLDHATVDSANGATRFNPERVRPVWRL